MTTVDIVEDDEPTPGLLPIGAALSAELVGVDRTPMPATRATETQVSDTRPGGLIDLDTEPKRGLATLTEPVQTVVTQGLTGVINQLTEPKIVRATSAVAGWLLILGTCAVFCVGWLQGVDEARLAQFAVSVDIWVAVAAAAIGYFIRSERSDKKRKDGN